MEGRPDRAARPALQPGRARPAPPALIEGVEVHVVSPEDLILAKLEWAKLGESERQLGDVRAVLRSSGSRLDWAYLRRSAEELGVGDTLEQLEGSS
jgi:predicted nucleotidyltransferase